LRLFRAIPAYFGGKRRLLGPIFRDLPLPAEAPIFVDPFLGGGSVSLYAKARGYQVLCNDLADRSYIIGKALIENGTRRLTSDEIVELSQPIEEVGYAETNLAPEVLPLHHARFIDRVLVRGLARSGGASCLARLLVVHHVLRLRPMGNFGARTIMRQLAEGQWEDMNPHYVRDLVSRGIPRHPIRLADQLRRRINAGVFANGHRNEAHQGDAVEFITGAQGDICYLDPPYSGTQSYEKAMKPLDELLAGGPIDPAPNPYSTEPPEVCLPRLFEAADHYPVLVLSYGNQRIDLAGLMDLMRRHGRRVEGRAINYIHCTGLASEESRRRNQELLVIGRK
jgi:hypothetical protein